MSMFWSGFKLGGASNVSQHFPEEIVYLPKCASLEDAGPAGL